MTKLLSSGKEQVRLVMTPLMEQALVVFLIKDREALNAFERLARSKAMESAIDYIVMVQVVWFSGSRAAAAST